MLYNLQEYHCPVSLDEALRLLRRENVHTAILAGGTDLIGQRNGAVEAVIDLAGLGLDFIERADSALRLGAMVRLQTIVEELPDVAGGLLAETAHRMAGCHIRNVATLGGTLAGGRLHSPLGVALAALGARVEVAGETVETLPWPKLPPEKLNGKLVTAVVIELPGGEIGAAYEQVGRTPADQPIVCAAAVADAAGEGAVSARVAVGGLLADDLQQLELTVTASHPDISPVSDIASGLPETALLSDHLGSAAYRQSIAPTLARRALIAALGRAGVSVG